MENLIATLTQSVGSIGTSAISVIGSVLPTALTIVGAVMVVTLGIGFFTKISKKK